MKNKPGPKPRLATASRPPSRSSTGSRWKRPTWLTGEALAAWDHLVGLLRRAGNLDRTDPTIVETYAVNVGLLRDAYREIEAKGLIVENSVGGATANPACAIVNSSTMRLKAIAYDLGLTPSSSKQPPASAVDPSGTWAQFGLVAPGD